MKEIPFITLGLDFTYRIKAQRLGFNKYVNVSFEEISGLAVNHISLPSTKTPVSYSIDEYGRLIIPISGEGLACNTYGLELTGFYNNGNWRRQEVPTVEIVKASYQDNYALQESDDRTIDITITLGETTVSSRVFQSTIEAVRKNIADSEGVGDVKINGRSIVETNPISGKKEVNFQKDMLGKVDDVKVNGESVLNENNVANIEVPTTVEELNDSSDFAKKSDLQTMQSEIEGNISNITQQLVQAIGDATVTEVEATVDNNTGTPEVDYSFENGKIQLDFKKLKGEKGDKLLFSDLTAEDKASLKGRQGDSAVFNPESPDHPLYEMASYFGGSTTKSMTQKVLTEGLAGYVKMSFTIDDLEEHGVENNTTGEAIQINTSSSLTAYKHALFPVSPGQHGRITTIAGTSLLLAYCFVDANNIVLAKSSTDRTHENEDFTVPEGAAYIGVNFMENNQGVVFSLQLYGVEKNINDIEEALEEVDGIKDEVKDLQDVLSPRPAIYEASDLEDGQVSNAPIGSEYFIGTVNTIKHLIIPCIKGQTVTITTSGSSKSGSNFRGIGFADINGVVLQTTPLGPISGDYEAPENSAFCLVNCMTDALETFSMEVSPKPTWLEELRKDVDELREDVDELINTHTEDDIPLYHGKDMFFIKDTPLDFYAQNVLFKNYPKYKGVFVNCARDLSRRSTTDFSVPVITHVNPTGKVYFKNDDIVDIYADDGKLYKDSWNAVTNITVHTTDLETKQKNIKALFFGSSTTEYGLATYVKNYLNTLGVTMTCLGHKNDALNTPSEGYAGWSNEMICGKRKSSSSASISTSPFIRLATAADKQNYPDYCFKYGSGVDGTSYTDASDKTGDFYIFDFAWFLQQNGLDTPDVVFFLLGINGTKENYGIYMPWIVDRIMQACPDCKIGINVAQAIRLQTDAGEKIEDNCHKFDMLYQYVAEKDSPNLKIVSCHCYQSPYFSHKFSSENGENAVTTKVTMDMTSNGGYLHMRNAGYQQIAKAIGAYIAYCLPNS